MKKNIRKNANLHFEVLYLFKQSQESNISNFRSLILLFFNAETLRDDKTNSVPGNLSCHLSAKDYSMNNPFVAESYNSAGYPTKINMGTISNWAGTEIRLSNSEFSYCCRQAYW